MWIDKSVKFLLMEMGKSVFMLDIRFQEIALLGNVLFWNSNIESQLHSVSDCL
jgi:hypothetical protein